MLDKNQEIDDLKEKISSSERDRDRMLRLAETQEETEGGMLLPIALISLVVLAIAFWFGYKYIFSSRIKQAKDESTDRLTEATAEEEYEDHNDDRDEIKNDLDSSMEIANVDSQLVKNLIKHFTDLRTQVDKLEKHLETTDSLRKEIETSQNAVKSYINGYNFSVLQLALKDFIEAYEYASETDLLLTKELQGNSSDVQGLKDLKGYIEAISINLNQGLEATGIEEYRPEIGSQYSSSSGTEMIGSTPTSNPEEDGTIAEVVKPGWKTKMPDDPTKQKVLRKATVRVYALSTT